MRYTLLGTSGLRVSELALGTMTFGEDWGWGADEATSRRLFEQYADAGGNFVDTANNYTNGTAERIVGSLLAEHGRDQFVLATKYTLSTREGDPNACGNGRKNLFQSVESSLDRLDTDYIDLLWVHAWDELTPLREVMRGLDDLVAQGTVHYVGISDAPAWVVARAQTLAEERGWTPFAAVQLKYNPIERTPERDLLPMARDLGIGVTVWGALESGILAGKYLDDGTGGSGGEDATGEGGRVTTTGREITPREHEIAAVVVDVADDLGLTPAQVTLAWVRGRPGQFVPILGATKPEQLSESLGVLDVSLPDAARDRIDDASAVSGGFPHDFLRQPTIRGLVHGGLWDRIDPYVGRSEAERPR